MSKFERKMARKSGLTKDFLCIHNDEVISFLYWHSMNYQKFLVAQNPTISELLEPLTIDEFYDEFYLKHCLGLEDVK